MVLQDLLYPIIFYPASRASVLIDILLETAGSDSARTSADADTTVPGGSRAGTADSLPQLFDEISMPLRVIPKRSARMIFLSL